MMTREQYMEDGSKNHHQYFIEFAETYEKKLTRWILSRWTIEQLKKAYAEDVNMNNLPRPEGYAFNHREGGSHTPWMNEMDSSLGYFKSDIAIVNKIKCGSPVYSYSDNCCIIKAMMRKLIGESK